MDDIDIIIPDVMTYIFYKRGVEAWLPVDTGYMDALLLQHLTKWANRLFQTEDAHVVCVFIAALYQILDNLFCAADAHVEGYMQYLASPCHDLISVM
jgi:hypothetical protein